MISCLHFILKEINFYVTPIKRSRRPGHWQEIRVQSTQQKPSQDFGTENFFLVFHCSPIFLNGCSDFTSGTLSTSLKAFYWVLLGFTAPQSAKMPLLTGLMSSTGLYLITLDLTGVYWVILGYNGLSWVILGSTWFSLGVVASHLDQVPLLTGLIRFY